ncbi:MAG TPA: UDP-3-O-(3-hydroxymyristoyl)glucosamine N-acyltransferase [Thermoanaerobaculia bacterium]|nr:UDP-3-O-(3-hydroxymyristoyl)glucosamine N-acyltransferase [Thermoanaerobaculia bacterium]
MPSVTVGEIVELVEGEFSGDRERRITGARSLEQAGPEDLSFLANARYQRQLATTRAGAVLVERGMAGESSRWIRVRDPYYALARVLQKFFAEIPLPEGISPLSSIAPSARIGAEVRIGPFVTIGPEAIIGDRVVLFEGVSIGAGASVGADTRIHPNAVVYHRCVIGSRCIIHAGAVIGADGFGFATHEGVHHKIPQIGIVRIEDDVEVGAGSAIDRAALGETVIGAGTKIDNLVQVGHNARVGRGCLLVSQCAIAGSAELGEYSALGGQAGLTGHIRVGSRVMVAAQSAVMKDFEGPGTVAGNPARPLREHLRAEALVRKLPEIVSRLDAVEAALRDPGHGTTKREDPC